MAYAGTIEGNAPSAAHPPPAGWLLCDGSAVDQVAYPQLFAVLGTSYGDGTAGPGGPTMCTTCFNLPDYRGQILRGLSGASGVEQNGRYTLFTTCIVNTGGPICVTTQSNYTPDIAPVGSRQADAFAGHTHRSNGNGYIVGYPDSVGGPPFGLVSALAMGKTPDISLQQDSNTGLTGSGETVPKNVSVNYIIKY